MTGAEAKLRQDRVKAGAARDHFLGVTARLAE